MAPFLNSHALLACWEFRETTPPFLSNPPHYFPLTPYHAKIEKSPPSSSSPPSIRIPYPGWLHLPRHLLGPLNFHGYQPLTLIIRACPDSDRPWQFLAGIWNEHDHRRQFALFYNGTWKYNHLTNSRSPARFQLHAYLSKEGGHTPGHPACFSYATAPIELPPGNWHTFAMTWDGSYITAYVDGKLHPVPGQNPLPFAGPIFDGGPNGADFTVAQRSMALWHNYPYDPCPANEGFSGLLSFLALFQRALSPEEIASLHSQLSSTNSFSPPNHFP
ncbi:MAG: LamG domain-containing protein [Chthoniobacterales bacterium]|nr:LamG domain-containing protein [Chthoniobacterales bacterium]